MTTNLKSGQYGQSQSGRTSYVLVKDGYTAQRTGGPFLVVLLEVGVNGLQEWADERYFP
jgi:hypothetical protein